MGIEIEVVCDGAIFTIKKMMIDLVSEEKERVKRTWIAAEATPKHI